MNNAEERFCTKDGCVEKQLRPDMDCSKCGFFRPEAERRRNLQMRRTEDGRRYIDINDTASEYRTFRAEPEQAEDLRMALRTAERALQMAIGRMQREGICRYKDATGCMRARKSQEGCRNCLESFYRERAARDVERKGSRS